MLKLLFVLFAFLLVTFFRLRRPRVPGPDMPLRYAACWTEDDGIYFCGHHHVTVTEAINCLVPYGGSFIRAVENGKSRSLNESEYQEFLIALKTMSWSDGTAEAVPSWSSINRP